MRESRHPEGRGQRGFTLAELVIAMLVLLVGMAIALDLFVEAARLTAAAGIRARDPLPELATDRLRDDLRAARPPSGFPMPVWAPLPLSLDRPYAGPVRWELAGDRLVRVTPGPDGPTRRAWLDGVVSARWRIWPPGHFEVLVIAIREGPAFVAASRGRTKDPAPVTIRLLVGPRGEGDGW